MADKIFLTNDGSAGSQPQGYEYFEDVFRFNYGTRETSAHGASSLLVPVAIMQSAGRIMDFFIGVVNPALSVSGFVSGTITGDVRINSALVCSTAPVIAAATTSAGVVKKATNTGGGTSAVINTASAAFSAGDMISLDYNLQSAGSVAAAVAGAGFYAGIRVRYTAR